MFLNKEVLTILSYLVVLIFSDDAWVFELKKLMKLQTSRVRRTNKINLSDTIIAVTSLVPVLVLLTGNLTELKSIPDLHTVNLHAL